MSDTKAEAVFSKFLESLFVVLNEADQDSNVLNSVLPKQFYEPDPCVLSESYLAFIEDNADIEYPTTTVNERFEENYYTKVYQIYHDLTLSCIQLISKNPIGSPDYLKADYFFKFSSELLLRESFRMRLNLAEFIDAKDNLATQTPPSEFEESLLEDLTKISTSFTVSNGEAYFILTSQNNMPLFSSLNGKSVLDEREVITSENIQTTKIIPQSFPIPAPKMNFVSPQVSKIPNPTLTPTELMTNFFHPNWYTLSIPKWMSYNNLESFGPNVDGHDSIISNELKNSVWLEQIGLKKIAELTENYKKKIAGINENLDGDSLLADTDENVTEKNEQEEKLTLHEQEKHEEQQKHEEQEETNGSSKSAEVESGSLEINLDYLVEWTPGSKIEEDEIEAVENGTEQQLISKLLIDLNKLRHKRYLKSTPNQIQAPSSYEKQIYFKIQRLIVNLVGELTPGQIGLEFSEKLPVLMNNYAGTLPAPTPPVQRQPTSRLPGLTRGPYKKRK